MMASTSPSGPGSGLLPHVQDQSPLSRAWTAYMSCLQGHGNEREMLGLDLICTAGHCNLAVVAFFECLQSQLSTSGLPAFWTQIQNGVRQEDTELEGILLSALGGLVALVERQQERVNTLWSTVVACTAQPCSVMSLQGMLYKHATQVTASLMVTSSGVSLQGVLQRYHESKLMELSEAAHRQSLAADLSEDDEGSDDEDADRTIVLEECVHASELLGHEWAERLRDVACALDRIGLAPLNENISSGVVYMHVQQRLLTACKGKFDRRVLAGARRYVETLPLEFILHATGRESEILPSPHSIALWERLDYHVFNTIAEMRIGEMFDIVVDYPDSLPAIEDLRECLSNTNNQHQFICSFTAAIRKRLLHAGAATTDIIQQYVSTIRALRDLDPSGVLLEAVGLPIKDYLKGRKDTIRCVVTMLTDDSGEEGSDGRATLFAELGRHAEPSGSLEDESAMETDEAVFLSASTWEPDPVEADTTHSTASRRKLDVISMLVEIYGSKELFINEYRIMLADRLLAKMDFDTQREIRTLELLKLRFGETNLHNCEIMLKDLADSKRISANVKKLRVDAARADGKEPADLSTFGATIVSPLFWPPFKGEQLKLPPQVQRMADTYADRYHKLKAPRKLVFGYQLGTAELEIQIGEKVLQFQVSALHAAIVMCFQEKKEWKAGDLAEAVGVPLGVLRQKIVYWISAGVLAETRPAGNRSDADILYRALESYADQAASRQGKGAPGHEEEPTSNVASAEEQLAADMAVFESFVIGMLTNHDEMSLDKIHNMLKMFAGSAGYDKSTKQLAAFLGKLVRDEKLVCEAGMYRKRSA